MRFLAEGLYENERSWLGSGQLLTALTKLGIDASLYELPSPYVLSAGELQHYVESIQNEIRHKPSSEYRDYIDTRCQALKKWAEKGLIVHVL